MKQKIIIFGGSGFIGYNLIQRLKKKNFQITSVSRKKTKKNHLIKGIKYLYCDVSKKNDLKKIQSNYEYIINLSGNINHKNKVETFNTHYLGCKNLVNIFSKKKIKLFIQVGSSLEYGRAKVPHTENSRVKPNSNYGLAKLKATNIIKKIHQKEKFPFIVLRLYQVFGRHQKFDRLIPYIIKCALDGKNFNSTEGKQIRDFLFIDDLIDLFCKILKKKNIKNGIYNVGSGKPKKIKSIIQNILQIIKKGNPLFGKIKMRKDESIKLYPSILKVKKTFDWKPKTHITKGLRATIDFYAKQKKTLN